MCSIDGQSFSCSSCTIQTKLSRRYCRRSLARETEAVVGWFLSWWDKGRSFLMKDPPKLKPHKLVGSCGLNHYAEDVWSNLGFKEPKLLIISPSIPHWQPLQRSASSCFYCTYEILCGIKASSSSGLSSDLSLEKKTWFRRRWDISTGVYSSAVTPQERWIRSWSLI